MILFFLAFLSQANAVTVSPDIQRILSKGEIRVAMHEEDTRPFFYQASEKNGEKSGTVGIDAWLSEQIASHLGVKLKIIRTAKHFDNVIDQVEKREADIALAALYPTLERAKSVLFSNEYCSVNPILLIHRSKSHMVGTDSRILAIAQSGLLQNKSVTIGVYGTGIIPQKAARRFPKAQLKPFKDREALIQAVMTGEIGAAYIDELEEQKWRTKVSHFDLYLRAISDSEASLPISIALNSKDTQLQYWLNLLIAQLKAEGEIDKKVKAEFGAL